MTAETSYDERRDTCPKCASTEVRHLIIGMPSGPDDMDGSPEWVSWVGCIDPGFNRECGSCGYQWGTAWPLT